MDKYEFGIKLEEVQKLARKKEYDEASRLAATMDFRHVRDWPTLAMIINVHEAAGDYEDARDVAAIAYNRNLGGRKLIYKLTELLIRTGEFKDAESMCREYEKASKNDASRLILRYHLRRAQKAPDSELIQILEEYRKSEVDERYLYRLAELYSKTGQKEHCISVCDEICVYFHSGEFAERAVKLKKSLGAPLTPEQQELYDNSDRKLEKLEETRELLFAEQSRLAQLRQDDVESAINDYAAKGGMDDDTKAVIPEKKGGLRGFFRRAFSGLQDVVSKDEDEEAEETPAAEPETETAQEVKEAEAAKPVEQDVQPAEVPEPDNREEMDEEDALNTAPLPQTGVQAAQKAEETTAPIPQTAEAQEIPEETTKPIPQTAPEVKPVPQAETEAKAPETAESVAAPEAKTPEAEESAAVPETAADAEPAVKSALEQPEQEPAKAAADAPYTLMDDMPMGKDALGTADLKKASESLNSLISAAKLKMNQNLSELAHDADAMTAPKKETDSDDVKQIDEVLKTADLGDTADISKEIAESMSAILRENEQENENLTDEEPQEEQPAGETAQEVTPQTETPAEPAAPEIPEETENDEGEKSRNAEAEAHREAIRLQQRALEKLEAQKRELEAQKRVLEEQNRMLMEQQKTAAEKALEEKRHLQEQNSQMASQKEREAAMAMAEKKALEKENEALAREKEEVAKRALEEKKALEEQNRLLEEQAARESRRVAEAESALAQLKKLEEQRKAEESLSAGVSSYKMFDTDNIKEAIEHANAAAERIIRPDVPKAEAETEDDQIEGQLTLAEWAETVREEKYGKQDTRQFSKAELERMLDEKDEKSEAYDKMMQQQREEARKAGRNFDETAARHKVEAAIALHAAQTDLQIRTGKATMKLEEEAVKLMSSPSEKTAAAEAKQPVKAASPAPEVKPAAKNEAPAESAPKAAQTAAAVIDKPAEPARKEAAADMEKTRLMPDRGAQELARQAQAAQTNRTASQTEKPVKQTASQAGETVQKKAVRPAAPVQKGAGTQVNARQQKKRLPKSLRVMFTKYLNSEGIETQLYDYFSATDTELLRQDSSVGNLLITGTESADKTGLARTIVHAINFLYPDKRRRVARTTGESINVHGIRRAMRKLYGTVLIVEDAGTIKPKSMQDMLAVMKGDTGRMIVILEDNEKAIQVLQQFNPEMNSVFNHTVTIKEYTVDELVKIAQGFARARKYDLDDDALLELYLRVNKLHEEKKTVSLDDLHSMIDAAITHAENRKSGLFHKKKTRGEYALLTDSDFKD
ncbi:MAG: hypothetical protein ACOX78_06125 [Lachnospiraceae bacterium]